jgi:hypothetical protein
VGLKIVVLFWTVLCAAALLSAVISFHRSYPTVTLSTLFTHDVRVFIFWWIPGAAAFYGAIWAWGRWRDIVVARVQGLEARCWRCRGDTKLAPARGRVSLRDARVGKRPQCPHCGKPMTLSAHDQWLVERVRR